MATKQTEARTLNLVPLAIVAAFLAIGGALFYWLFLRPPGDNAQTSQLTSDARAYVRNLALSETDMKASENYMKAMVVELTGKITNNGDRPLRLVELNCVFYDPNGQVVLRERVPIVRNRSGAFQPKESRSFRLPFDSIPAGWNQAMPQLVIARIDFDN